ncbi:small subunit processome component 20 homolog [Penaeus chinensis]|uniref:small subunit processome component 20 homolog n=1 Tax=Penaeus chinensis TaxID=139456 RepID=UPI001FB6D33F|nr:small subunit processome component 20 homolog [Penaeus chinensis]
MKEKPNRQAHKATNTFTFKKFSEKVRGLRVSARKFLLQRAHSTATEQTSVFHQTFSKCRELNLTEAFQAFQEDLKYSIVTTAQLVHHENRIATCLTKHLAVLSSPALQPLLDLLVAFANDIPQEFYQNHFYKFLSILLRHLSTKEPEQIESVFLCIVSLFVVLQKYLRNDLFELYHVHNYARLLSKSHPWYINELAAQSLAFLVRKAPNMENFLGMALRKLKKDETHVDGLGRLFAALMKSDVVQRLHSSTPVVLNHLLNLLAGEDVPPDLALQAVCSGILTLNFYITTPHPDKITRWEVSWEEDSKLVWPTVWEQVKSILPHTQTSDSCHHLHAIIQVIQKLVSFKRGALVADLNDALNQCVAIIQMPLPDSIGTTVCDIVSVLLTSRHQPLTHAMLHQTVTSIFMSQYSHSVKFSFVKQMVDFERFDTEILPVLLHYLSTVISTTKDADVHKDVVSVIAYIILTKQIPCNSGLDLSSWEKYPIDFTQILAKMDTSVESNIPSYIEDKVSEGIQDDLSNLEELLLILVCLPHISPLNHEKLKPHFQEILKTSIMNLNDVGTKITPSVDVTPKKKKTKVADLLVDVNVKYDISLTSRRLLFLVGMVVEGMAHVLSGKQFLACLDKCSLLDVLMQKPHYRENVHFLKAIDLQLSIASREEASDVMNEAFLKRIYPSLAPVLASANPQVRLLGTHIFSLFPVTLPPPPENVENVENIFQIMLKVEMTPVTPFSFRDRVRFLETINGDLVKVHKPVCDTYVHAPLLFFLGQLFVNYKDLWNPCLKGISSYAHTLPLDSFWQLWFAKLKIATDNCQQMLINKVVDPDEDLDIENEIIQTVVQHLSSHQSYSKVVIKADHMNYRDLMWRSMEKFPDVCEARSRDLVPLFFDFLHNELFPVDFNVAPTQNISKTRREETSIVEEEISMNESGMDALTNIEDKIPDSSLDEDLESEVRSRRVPLKALGEQLAVFSKFHNPRKLSQTKKLQDMYKEFLTHPAPSVQRKALNCIMTYNYPYLVPYTEFLYKLIDDKSFKNAITLFSLDGSEQTVSEEHREDMMPYLMRILFGKMHSKAGTGTSGKGKILIRKGVILRYLAGAKESELRIFLDLAFDVLLSHIEGDALTMVERTKQTLDITKVVPLGRLRGALTTLDNIISKMGNLLMELLPTLLKVVLFIANLATTLLEQRTEIGDRSVSLLKHLRQDSHRRLIAFFKKFENYTWSENEINAVFEAVVWPNLKRLPDEGISSPSTLLILFKCWSENPRYFPLLIKCHREDHTLTPLPYVMKLLNHEKCKPSVVNVILDMVENLINLQDFEDVEEEAYIEGKKPSPLSCSPVIPVKRLQSRDGTYEQNLGTALLVPHMEGLLKSMKSMVTKLSKNQLVKERDLTILRNLSEWVTNKENSSDLLSLIAPLIVKKNVEKIEKVPELLTICSHLLQVVDNSAEYLAPFISQFGTMGSRDARESLCNVVSVIASSNPKYKELAEMAEDLNSWNPKMVEEVDYERRLSAHDHFKKYCTSTEVIDVEYCQLFLFNSMYLIRQVDDSSLRDMSSFTLCQMIDMLVRLQPKFKSEFERIVANNFLTEIRKGLHSKKEKVRIEIISLLKQLILKCHGQVERLQDLYKLVNETETDMDFYCNMGHIQRHRRARAMARLSEKLDSGEISLASSTVDGYLLPLVTSYLFQEAYIKDDYLITSSISCLGSLAKKMPWYSYQKLLKYYLNMLSKQELKFLKQAVRVLESVLDGFHEEVEIPAVEDIIVNENIKKPEDPTATLVGTEDVQAKMGEEGVVDKEEENLMVEKEEEEGLGKEEAEEEVADDEEEEQEKEIEQATSISKGQRVYGALVGVFIPQLQKTLAARTKADTEHKVNKSKYPEDEDIKRIPLAFALVKLLKKLPQKMLDTNINGVLMKVIHFLKSRAESIRDEARSMLVKIMVEIGGSYLLWVVRDLRSILTRGYQAHVLVYTLHAILSQLRPLLTSTDINVCLRDMIEICKEDILGVQAEEKEVSEITRKVKESRGNRSYAILAFTAEFISAECLQEIILPLKEVLTLTQDKKVVNKMVRCLSEICSGLERNENIPITQKSVFIYGMLNEKILTLTAEKEEKKPSEKKGQERIDSFILEPEPKKTRLNPKTSFKATAHVLIEFAVQFLAGLLKKGKFIPEDKEHAMLLDPFLKVLTKCIDSEYPEICVYALRCISIMIKFPLPSLQTDLKNICEQMFLILHKFSSPELAKGKIYDLVQLSFKSLAHIVKSVDSYLLNEEELRILLQYLSGNIQDHNQQQTAFVVLQSIIARKINAPELHKLMRTVQKMSVTCGGINALTQARTTFYTYLLTYPMKPKIIEEHITFYLGNTSYSELDGRLSASIMINNIVANFPAKLLGKKIETNMWFSLSKQLIVEESQENKTLLHKALKTMFKRSKGKKELIDLCLQLIRERPKSTVKTNSVAMQMGLKALSAFLDVTVKLLPEIILSKAAPMIIQLLEPSRYSVQFTNMQEDTDDINLSKETYHKDNCIVALLEVFTKIVRAFFTHENWSKHTDPDVWKYVQAHLLYPHIQVRLNAAGLIGYLLAAHPVEESVSPPLATNTDEARSLALDICEQLRTEAPIGMALLTQLSLSVIRNLIYLVRHSCKVPLVKKKGGEVENVNGDSELANGEGKTDMVIGNEAEPIPSAVWVVRHVGNFAYEELQRHGRDSTIVRESLLNLIAGLVVVVGEKINESMLLGYIVKHLARELSDEKLPENLATKTKEVATMVKGLVGVEVYTRHLTAAQVVLAKKRHERKARNMQQRALNPALADKKRKKKNLTSRESKKRKIAERKGKIIRKKKAKLIDRAVVADR